MSKMDSLIVEFEHLSTLSRNLEYINSQIRDQISEIHEKLRQNEIKRHKLVEKLKKRSPVVVTKGEINAVN